MAVDTIKTTAEESGLLPEHITILLDAACSGYFGWYHSIFVLTI
jgi:hypothetical protein